MTTEYSDTDGDDEALAMQVAGTLAARHAADARVFLNALARLLDDTLPGEAEIKRGGLFGGDNRPVKQIRVFFRDPSSADDGTRFTLDDPGRGPLSATQTRIVRGIALKTAGMEIADWIAAVGAAIAARAAGNKATRDALRALLD